MEIKMEIEPFIKYWNNGNKKTEYWLLAGKYHRVGSPAFISYYALGTIQEEYWYLNGDLHRADAPAIVYYSKSNKIKQEYWYIVDKKLKDEEVIVYKEWLIDNNLFSKDYNTWTDEEKILWKLRWK